MILQDRARIEDLALFVGLRRRLRNLEPADSRSKDDDAELRELAAYHLAEKGGAA